MECTRWKTRAPGHTLWQKHTEKSSETAQCTPRGGTSGAWVAGAAKCVSWTSRQRGCVRSPRTVAQETSAWNVDAPIPPGKVQWTSQCGTWSTTHETHNRGIPSPPLYQKRSYIPARAAISSFTRPRSQQVGRYALGRPIWVNAAGSPRTRLDSTSSNTSWRPPLVRHQMLVYKDAMRRRDSSPGRPAEPRRTPFRLSIFRDDHLHMTKRSSYRLRRAQHDGRRGRKHDRERAPSRLDSIPPPLR